MWNCRSKLKLDGQYRFHAGTDTSPRFVSTTRCNRGLWARSRSHEKRGTPVPRVELSALRLFQLALGFFRKVQMLLNYFCRIIRKLLHFGISPTASSLFACTKSFL